jgi:hypothetical protein
MPQIPTKDYTLAYAVATGAVLETSISTSYPELPQQERRDLAIDILNSIAHRHGYRLVPLITVEEDDGE